MDRSKDRPHFAFKCPIIISKVLTRLNKRQILEAPRCIGSSDSPVKRALPLSSGPMTCYTVVFGRYHLFLSHILESQLGPPIYVCCKWNVSKKFVAPERPHLLLDCMLHVAQLEKSGFRESVSQPESMLSDS